jgi:SAM-dependent methyltransferase
MGPRGVRAGHLSSERYHDRMFQKSQRFYDAVYSWKDYPAEVRRLDAAIRARNPEARTLLDVACGTGRHLALLRDRYEVEGLDVDPEMLKLARDRLGPDVPLHLGDMVDFDLAKRFDVVTCLFSSIAYTRTDTNLRQAVGNLVRHAAPNGLVVVEPFFSPDDWKAGHLNSNFVDEPELKIARLVLSGPAEDEITMTFHYLVGTADGIEQFTEDHRVGLFHHRQYLDAFRAAGLEPAHDPEGLMGRGLYMAVRPG